jgi:UDP-N-acetylglucosamine--N-acetylmuramyl-(pentapeptide) pyrophosphoryl-undecaprenol N-acetylglucosamine transferase
MDAAYAAADAIVSRAGGTIAELCVVGKPAILLPSPHVAEDHQTKNVQSLVDHDAGVLIRDSESIEKLGKTAVELMQDQARMDRLAQSIKALARPNAADDIASAVIRLMQGEAAVQTSPA